MKKFFLFLVMIWLPAASGADTTLFEDDFENVAAVQWPNPSLDADPVAQTGTWSTVFETNDYDIQVCNNGSPGPAEGANYLVMDRSGYASSWANMSAPVANAYLYIRFDMYVAGITDDPEDAYNNGLDFFLRNNTNFGFSDLVLEDTFHANGSITHRNSSNVTQYIGEFPTDTWVPVEYNIDLTARKYSLTAGSYTWSDLDFNYPLSSCKQMVFYNLYTRSTVYVDEVFCAQVSELPINTESRSMYISTGDNLWVLWLPMDSYQAVSTAIDTLKKDWKIDRILWRGGQDELWDSMAKFRPENRFYQAIFDWITHAMKIEHTNQAAIDSARRNDMQIWAIDGLFEYGAPPDTGGCGVHPYSYQKWITVEHPEWIPVNKYGTRVQTGPIEYAYPEARQYVVDTYAEFLTEQGYDGLAFYTYAENFGIRYMDEFGYNQPIVDEFQRRYGIDIRTEVFDKVLWHKLRGEYVTQFLRELHGALAPQGKKIAVWLNCDDLHYPMYWGTSPLTKTAGNIYLDWERWVDEGIVDELMVYWPGNSTYLQEVLDYCEGTNVAVSTMVSYGALPAGTIRVLMPGAEVESGYAYENKIGWPDENTYPEPLSSLYGTDVYAKRRALYLIETGSLSATVADIVPVLNDADIYVRRASLRALVTISDPAGVPYLEAALTDPQNSVRCQAAVCLGTLRDTDSVQKMLEAVDTHGTFQYDFVAIAEAWIHLKNTGQIYAADTDAFIWALTHANPEVKRAACRDLYQMGCGDIPALKPYLLNILQNDPDPWTRELALLPLTYFQGDSAVLNAFRVAFNSDPDHVVQLRTAIYQSFEMLMEKLTHYGQFSTRIDAQFGWRTIGEYLMNWYNAEAQVALADFMVQKDDPLLAEIAWRILYMKQKIASYDFVTEQQDAQGHQNYPIFQNAVPVTVFRDDFESAAYVSAYPDVNADADPGAAVGTWSTVDEADMFQIQVTCDRSLMAAQKGRFLAVSNSSAAPLRADLTLPAGERPKTVIDFVLRLDSSAGSQFEIKARDALGTGDDHIAAWIIIEADGRIYNKTAGSLVNTGLKINRDQWHRIICVIDAYNGTLDIYANDKQALALSPYSSQPQIRQVIFGSPLIGSVFHLDDIDITVTADCLYWSEADLNFDCKVDMHDFAIFTRSFMN